jgi:hypothetical protein
VSFLLSSTKIEDGQFLIWNFADCLSTPFLFINAINELLHMRTPVRGRLAQFPGTLDFIFDHYFPLLETFPLERDPEAAICRINLFQFLCKLLVDYPDRILRFSDFHRMMWNRLLRLMKNSSPTVAIAAFRTATSFFRTTMDKIDTSTQAAWMLKLVQTNAAPSLLHHPSLRFAMVVRPQEFGFVTPCKTLIDQGIRDQCDLGMISRVLRLPVVKNPTDVFQYLFKLATTDKLLGNAAQCVIQRPLSKFKDLPPLRPWAIVYTKRSFQFAVFAHAKGKYIRRVYLILYFYTMLLTLNIEWITKTIVTCASTIVNMGRCAELFANRFPITDEVDPKFRDEIDKTPIERLDIKRMLSDVKVKLRLMDEPESEDEPGSARSSARGSARGNPTIAEVKARFRAARMAGKQIQTTDLALLDDDMWDEESHVVDDDALDTH